MPEISTIILSPQWF